MIHGPSVALIDLVNCLSEAMDLIDPTIVNHHKQVAYIALSISAELGFSDEQRNHLVMAGAMHDIGALSLKERIEALSFELDNPHYHAEVGYQLLKIFKPFSDIAEIVRFHHVPWENGEGVEFNGRRVPIESHILNLADRVGVLIDKDEEIFSQVDNIVNRIESQKGTKFLADHVEAFKKVAGREYFWLDSVSSSIGRLLPNRVASENLKLHLDGVLELANLFRRIIDFRCEFTANHSTGVAVVAETMARLVGFSEQECKMMRIAGYLHDLGKLAVPVEILNKPSKLSVEEFNVVKRHTFYTYRVLEPIPELERINTWAAFHHERLDGSGYPFHIKGDKLPLGSRILAVADIFTAISEDRPYRVGMDREKIFQVLNSMVSGMAIDGNIVSMLQQNYDEVNTARIIAQSNSRDEYRQFTKDVMEKAV